MSNGSLLAHKQIGTTKYIYVERLGEYSEAVELVNNAKSLVNLECGRDFNICKFYVGKTKFSALSYPDLLNEPFPKLHKSWTIDLESKRVSFRNYEDSLNPPILHRKELLLGSDFCDLERCQQLTSDAEALGLFDDVKNIGYLKQWENLIFEKGYRLEHDQFVPLANDETATSEPYIPDSNNSVSSNVPRHLTALNRYGLSAPVQFLARHGFLDHSYSVFDYGCGHGTDLSALVKEGVDAKGWDPYFAPDNNLIESDIVNLGFVINVIEDFEERIKALTNAWSLTKQLLVVSVMLENLNRGSGQKFRDGFVSTRNTFQKYYSQNEIISFAREVLDVEPVAVAPGIIYAFKDNELEQDFQLKRYSRNRRRPSLKSIRVSLAPRITQKEKAQRFFDKNREPLSELWTLWLELGRRPLEGEVKNLNAIVELFGTLKKGLNFLEKLNGPDEIDRFFKARLEDLKVYFALGIFEQRSPYKFVSLKIRNDIKFFFGSIRNAKADAAELLYKIADSDLIEEACQNAKEHGLGWLEEGESLQLHSSMIEQLPAVLRVYIGCASALYGDYKNADLIKVHINSSKLTLMCFDDFTGKPVPRMLERVKIKFREQDIEYFDYVDEYEPPYLYCKSRYINEEFPRYPEQISFEEQLDELGLFDFSGYGPSPSEFTNTIKMHRLEIDGYELIRSKGMPDLDDSCGQYLTFRQLIECGETFKKTSIPNLPKQIETYNSLFDLATKILDPVIDYFGMIKLTYGFCSSDLARKVPGRIAPKLDQHASYELNRNGNYICNRLGAAVDFIVEDEDMLEVAQWVVANTPFDRLYYYGADKPIHLSYGPESNGEVVIMTSAKNERLMPKRISSELFAELNSS